MAVLLEMDTVASGQETFYETLEVDPKATEAQIRHAYISHSLLWHPDRSTDPQAKEKFQQVANAYFVLGDKARRADYDAALLAKTTYSFGGAGQENEKSSIIDPVKIFSTVFDDLLIPEVPNPTVFYERIGSVSGIVLGFIVLNIPGAIIGYYTGSRLGKVRDMKGKCVYEAFMKLESKRRAEILTHLMGKLGKGLIKNAIV